MIISDLCDEYAVLVSRNKAPAYGYDNTNVPYGWSSTMTVPWSEFDHWETSAGRSPSISFRYRLVSPVHQDCGELPLRQRHVPARLRHQRERQAFGAGVPSVRRIASTHTRWRQGPCRLRRMRLLLEGAAMADRPTTYGGRGMEIIGDDELRPGI